MEASKALLERPVCGCRVALVFAVLSSISSTAAQDTGKTIRHHQVEEQDPAATALTQAEAEIVQQDYRGAEPLLRKYLETYPESYAAWYDLGFVYHALGRTEDCIRAYRKSVESKPDVFESNLSLGLVLAESGHPDAELFLRKATNLHPMSAPSEGRKRAWMGLGRLLETSKPDDAIAAFEQAEALDPKDSEPHLLAGSILDSQGRAGQAEKEYLQAANLSPDSADPLIALSNLYMRDKQFAKAEAWLRKLESLRPKDAGVHLQLGRMLAISGKNQEAINEMETGWKLDPQDVKAQRDLADLYVESGKYDQAQPLYAALLQSNSKDANLHFGLGRVLINQKKFPEAEQEFTKAVQLKPDFGEAYGELAVAANENKNYALAIKATDLRGKYLPETAISYFLRATAYDHLHDGKQAAKYYHQFLDASAGNYPDQEWQARHRLIAIEPQKK